jgi:hypothetical protein
MAERRRITIGVPESLLKSAQDYTGAGVTETLRRALENLIQVRSQQVQAEEPSRGREDL